METSTTPGTTPGTSTARLLVHAATGTLPLVFVSRLADSARNIGYPGTDREAISAALRQNPKALDKLALAIAYELTR